MKTYAQRLLRWYDQYKRDLPWRHVTDPYSVWLSEVILQQTRVDQGMDYYLRFLQKFPTVRHLAEADESLVLKTWQGLGYYSRARNLHETAKRVWNEQAGVFPATAAELQKLKGIGPYTAAAIASFCYDECVPVMDGNVMRVLCRLYAIEKPIDSAAGKRMLESKILELIDHQHPGLFNQAMMEFGALQCKPAKPNCAGCIFKEACCAYQQGLVELLPLKASKVKVKNLFHYYFVVRDARNIYLRKRSGKDIWKGLYDFPAVESEMPLDAEPVCNDFMKTYFSETKAAITHVSSEYTHPLTHRKIFATFIAIKIDGLWKKMPAAVIAVPEQRRFEYPVPRLIEKYLTDVK
ncbi:MAG: A/G-specific adenine glycosylase [Flavobacteriales bacterium]